MASNLPSSGAQEPPACQWCGHHGTSTWSAALRLLAGKWDRRVQRTPWITLTGNPSISEKDIKYIFELGVTSCCYCDIVPQSFWCILRNSLLTSKHLPLPGWVSFEECPFGHDQLRDASDEACTTQVFFPNTNGQGSATQSNAFWDSSCTPGMRWPHIFGNWPWWIKPRKHFYTLGFQFT